MHSCTSYVPDKLNIYDHFIICPSSVTLTFNLRIFFTKNPEVGGGGGGEGQRVDEWTDEMQKHFHILICYCVII